MSDAFCPENSLACSTLYRRRNDKLSLGTGGFMSYADYFRLIEQPFDVCYVMHEKQADGECGDTKLIIK